MVKYSRCACALRAAPWRHLLYLEISFGRRSTLEGGPVRRDFVTFAGRPRATSVSGIKPFSDVLAALRSEPAEPEGGEKRGGRNLPGQAVSFIRTDGKLK